MADTVGTAALRARVAGRARAGTVTIRDFDQGVVETLGAKVIGDTYFITELAYLDPPPGDPGIAVVFSHPEDVFQRHRLPVIEVRRDDITPAMSRWHPGMVHYRVPSYGANPATRNGVSGFTRMETYQQSTPFDILYTVRVEARQREYMAAANHVIAYVMKVYQPYCRVLVRDSVGDLRSYEAFAESIAPIDNIPEVSNRVIGFSLSLRVEAELDLNDPTDSATVTDRIVNTRLLK